MSKTLKGVYEVKNPEKYTGNTLPFYRSSWELTFMRWCDNNPSIVEWLSEGIRIPYFNPVSNKQSIYVPDFFITLVDKHGNKRTELIEVKPKKETFLEHAKSKRDKYRLAVNAAKWKAAVNFCDRNGIKFRIITEDDIYGR